MSPSSPFEFEDWALLSLRYELHLLTHAFKKDVDDQDRPGFHESHLGFYYSKYFHKGWSTKAFGCNTFKAVVDLIKEHIALKDSGIVEALMSEETDVSKFVQQVEDHRRDRQRRIDAGVESAELKFQRHQQHSHNNGNGNGNGQHVIRPGQGASHGIKRPHSQGAQVPHIVPSWKKPKVIGAGFRR